MTHRIHRLLAPAGFAALMLAAATATGAAETAKVGVTAAVNPQVTGTPPGQSQRTLVLGNAVYHNERIRTESGGLLQVLFVDGTTFTVGPGTDLVIDSYVFDPATGTGKIAATMAKGVLRFVGGKISKAPNAVQINTMQGTIGIRGAVVNIDARSRDAGKIMFEFGRSANFCFTGGRCLKLFQQGWLLEISPGDPTGRIRKTEASDITLIQQALAGRRGQQGGAPQKPTGGQVERSNVASVDTTPPQTQPQTGGLKPLDDGLTLEDIPGLLNPIADIATDAIINDGGPNPPPPDGELEMLAAGLVTVEEYGAVPVFNLPGSVAFSGGQLAGGSLFTLLSSGEESLGLSLTFGPTADPSVATATDIKAFGSEGQPIAVEQPSSASLTASATPICQSCTFLRWGGWSATITTEVTGTSASQGLWVAGTPIPDARLPATGVASYQGSAHATVNNAGQQYQATGNLGMTWNFGERAGTMSISSFDSQNFEGGLSFTGAIAGTQDGGFQGGLFDRANGVGASTAGGFVSGPANSGADGPMSGSTPQGVAGTWNAFSEGYLASGVFGATLAQPGNVQ